MQSDGRRNRTTLSSRPVEKGIDLYLLWNDHETGDEDVNSVFVKLVYRF